MSHRQRLGKRKAAELLQTKRDAMRQKTTADLKALWKRLVRRQARQQ